MDDRDYMRLALQLAKSTEGQTTPNPLVGAVVVKNNQIIGLGAHLKAGEPHAEVHALTMAGEKAVGAVIYVTLEPCSHYGRTPPCADHIIEKGIRRVVIAATDPNSIVAGKGVAKLQEAGIAVEVGLLKEDADEINQVFYHYIETKKPFVTVKSATSLDGKTATVTGESKWITGEKAREDVHSYRHKHDGILVGVGTVLADNPSLTTRLAQGGKNPTRIILDHQLRTPLDSIVVTDGKAPTWIITSQRASSEKINSFQKAGITVFQLEKPQIEIDELLTLLGEKGISSLFVEGGAEVNGSFLLAKAVNQVITYIAPKLIGGRNAPTSFSGTGFESISDILSLEVKQVEKIGDDIKIISTPKGGE